MTLLPANGGWPASISYRTTAVENRSLRASTASPRSCSGAAYSGVPRTLPGCVSFVAATSMRRNRRGDAEVEQLGTVWREEDVGRLHVAVHQPQAVRGLEPRQHAERDADGLGDGDRPPRQPRPERSPSSSSIAMNCSPSSSPSSYSWQTAGWFTRAAMRASRSSRARSAPSAPVARRVLTAIRPLQPVLERRVDDAHLHLHQGSQ